MKVELTIWLHSHVDRPGEPYQFEIWDVTGENVPMDLLNYLIENNEDETEILFGGLETEYAYRVTLFVSRYEDHYESFVASREQLDVTPAPEPAQ